MFYIFIDENLSSYKLMNSVSLVLDNFSVSLQWGLQWIFVGYW